MSLVNAPEYIPDTHRVKVFMMIVSAGLFSILARLWYLQIAHGDEYLVSSDVNRIRLIRRIPPRGQIEDRNGKVLASSRRKIVVSVVPAEIRKNRGVLPLLSSLLNVPQNELADTIEANKIGAFDPVRVDVDLDIERATRIEERRMELPGVIVEPEPVRNYPDGDLFGHILGQMGQIAPEELRDRKSEGYKPGDFCGKLGIERAYDADLRGRDGGREVEVDARGRIRRELQSNEPVPGSTLRLTIDRDVQSVAQTELRSWLAKGHPGAAVALDVRTGAVLALVSVPGYDPNLFVTGITGENWNKLREDPGNPLVNRAISSAYAPGSTFKLITTAAGLETERTSPGDTAHCSGVMYLGKWRKRCHKSGGHGTVNLNEAIAKSCDIFFYHLGQKLGPERIAEYARKFGLGTRTGIDIVRRGDRQVERDGVVPDPEWKRATHRGEWFGGETVDYAIGQAMLACTPLQMCNATAAIANGGTLFHPQLVQSITSFDTAHRPHSVKKLIPAIVKRVEVSQSTLKIIAKGMRSVMEPGGTGAASAIPGLTIAGKTGTAQRISHGKMANDAWFIGYAPADKPEIAVCVFVQEGGHGGATAAPIARKMLAKYFHIPIEEKSVERSWD